MSWRPRRNYPILENQPRGATLDMLPTRVQGRRRGAREALNSESRCPNHHDVLEICIVIL
jgi:hypothetical protein